MRPHRVALVGIDGSGKSTLAQQLASQGFEVLSSLRNNEELSRTLDLMSATVDHLGSPDLKLAVLYLQMCMFGPTERSRTMALISDRHPVIDAAVYLPVFRPMLRGEDHARSILETLDPSALKQITTWADAQAHRLGHPVDLCTLASDLTALVDVQLPDQLQQLAVRMDTTLPDAVIYLDVSVPEAVRRITHRGSTRESHESPARLNHLRTGYDSVLRALPIPVHRIKVDRLDPTEVLHEVRRCL